MNRELMQRALDALKLSHQQNACDMYLTGEELRQVERSIFDLSAALAAPVAPAGDKPATSEPVGYIDPETLAKLKPGACA